MERPQRLQATATIPGDTLARALGLPPGSKPQVVTERPPLSPLPAHFPPSSQQALPLVSGLLVFRDPRKLALARRATQTFLDQAYPARQLIVVNATQPCPLPERELTGDEIKAVRSGDATLESLGIALVTAQPYVVTGEHPLVVEHLVPPNYALGHYLALGADLADGAWLTIWDEDAYSHPLRLAYQMAYAVPTGLPVLLRHQTRYNHLSATACVHSQPEGLSDTLLWPKTAARCPDTDDAPVLRFWLSAFAHRRLVADNTGPAPLRQLTVSFHYGLSATPVDEFMGRYAAAEYDRRLVGLRTDEAEELARLLLPYGIRLTLPPASPP